MERILNTETLNKINERVNIKGWVQARRDHGRIVFLDMRDRSGLLQVVVFNPELVKTIGEKNIAREFVLSISGTVAKRSENMINANITTGTVELQCEELEVLSASETPPFDIEDELLTDEEVRMQYRYLDLRRPTMLERFKLRHKVIRYMRNWLSDRDFIEVETPMLTKDTPEGAREYMVPSRVHPGTVYALPQSPQQFKQLLMVAGFEKYFQIAKCMRDEDPRGDRQPEFTQLDLEMSFIEQEDILQLTEQLFTELVKEITPEKHISSTPFKRLTYDESIKLYNSDKPDLRENKDDINELAFAFITDFPLFEKTKEGGITACHHPFTSWINKNEYNDIMNRVLNDEKVSSEELLSIRANCYDIVLNGYELGSGSIRIHNKDQQQSVFKALGIEKSKIEERFGHMLKAFSYGCPPHGGIAPGIDRFVMTLTNNQNIREVIAFPKTGDGRDLMMGAPSIVSDDKLKDLHLKKL
jgi:aspartyl-tRNA synthetase